MQALRFHGSTLLVRWSNKMITMTFHQYSLCDNYGAADRRNLAADQI